MRRKETILSYFLFCACTLFSQVQQRFVPFNVSNGLSQNSVHCIFQDKDGLLWLGTQDGLNSFDGRNFKTYRYNPSDTNSLSDHFVLSITEDANGFLWIGTGSGLNKLNKRTGKITRYYLDQEEKNKIAAYYPLLITNQEKGVFIQHKNSLAVMNKSNMPIFLNDIFKSTRMLAIDKQDNLWAISNHNKLIVFDKGTNYQNSTSFLLSLKGEVSISYNLKGVIDNNAILWLSTNEPNGRIFFFDTKKRQLLSQHIKLPTFINQVNVSHDGTGWISTLSGIYLVKDFVLTKHLVYSIDQRNTMLPGSILCSYEDKQGYIWIGSANAGFAYYHPSFNNYQLTTSSIDNNAVTAAVEIDGTNWLGTASGLFKIDNKDNKQKIYFDGKRISSLTLDTKNNIWAAIENEGLYILNSKGAVLKSYKQQDSLLATKNILRLFTDSKGRVFVCTETGYFVFLSLHKWQSFYQVSKGKNKTGWYTLNGFEDAQKNIWLCKHMGIDVLDENLQLKKQILSSDATSPIKRSITTACTQDKNGNMWIATLRSGIYQYQNEKLTQYTTNDGLTSNLIYGIACDGKGRVWAITTSGINVFVPNEKRFYPLSTNDGLPTNEYLIGALYKKENGQLIAGSSKGLITINANDIELQKKQVAAQIKDVYVNGESIDMGEKLLVIKPGYKTVSFNFSVNESVQPKNMYYQYRIKGLDDRWISITNENLQVTYTNLPFKKLTIQVRAAYSSLDLDSASIDEFSFEVKAPFWKTLFFKVLVVIILTGLIFYFVYVYNKRKYQKHLAALKTQRELQEERSRISRDLHDNIGAYTSALIAGINQLKTETTLIDQNINELNEYATNIMGYLRETIWVLNNEKLTLIAFIDRFKNYANRIVRNYPNLAVQYNIDIHEERVLSPQLSLNLFRILQEALQNACKHAEASIIDFSISNKEKMCCTISDDGKGISNKANIENYGLTNMKERAEEIGFLFSIHSEAAIGTTINLIEK